MPRVFRRRGGVRVGILNGQQGLAAEKLGLRQVVIVAQIEREPSGYLALHSFDEGGGAGCFLYVTSKLCFTVHGDM